jgi:GNAT superfamily N-acetyltransferase
MNHPVSLDAVTIRTELRPGDIGYWIYMHGALYQQEYHFNIQFETYVAKGLCEFYDHYDPARSRAWVCEHDQRIIGSLLLLDRGGLAQLRYFLLDPAYRGFGLGSKLMGLYMGFLKECGYRGSYLWTVQDLTAAAALYRRAGFRLTEEKETLFFGWPTKEQRYDLLL